MGFDRRSASALLLGGLLALTACVGDAPFKGPFALTPAAVPGDWPTSTPEAQGIDSNVLQSVLQPVFAESDAPNLRSVLVARHGVLVAEAYLRDPGDRMRARPIMSATKSLTSLLLGIAKDQGLITSLDQTLGELIPERIGNDETKARITLRDLLTMRSGIDFPNDSFSLEMEFGAERDSVAMIRSRPQRHAAGSKFNYQDADPHLVGAVLQKVTGQTLESYARERLFTPLGITDIAWLKHRDGTTYGAYGASLRPRDLLRIGQLCLQGGVWQDRRILSAEWLNEATRGAVVGKSQDEVPTFMYGYYWWVAPDASWYAAWGHGGQYVFVKPGQDLVLGITGDPNADGDHVAMSLERLRSMAEALETGMTR